MKLNQKKRKRKMEVLVRSTKELVRTCKKKDCVLEKWAALNPEMYKFTLTAHKKKHTSKMHKVHVG